MIKCVQNRVWMTNHIWGDLNVLKDLDTQVHPLFNAVYKKLHIRSDVEDVIQVAFSKVLLNQFQSTLSARNKNVRFDDIRLYLNDLGYMNLTIVFMHKKEFLFDDVEKTINISVKETINDHLSTFESLLDWLSDLNAIVKSTTYHFGVPNILLEHQMHRRVRSYLFNNHYFFIDEEELYQKLKEQGTPHHIYIDQLVKLFTINDSQWFWSLNKANDTKEMMDYLLYPNFLALTESQVYSNSMFCYTAYLNLLTRGLDLNIADVRTIINQNHLKLLKVKMLRPMLSHYQITHIEHHHQFMIDKKFTTYQSALNYLDYALNGKDVEANQKANRLIQSILAFFSLLTIYSVVTDVYMLVTHKDGITLNHVTSIIIGVVTLILIVIFYVIKYDRKRSSK